MAHLAHALRKYICALLQVPSQRLLQASWSDRITRWQAGAAGQQKCAALELRMHFVLGAMSPGKERQRPPALEKLIRLGYPTGPTHAYALVRIFDTLSTHAAGRGKTTSWQALGLWCTPDCSTPAFFALHLLRLPTHNLC